MMYDEYSVPENYSPNHPQIQGENAGHWQPIKKYLRWNPHETENGSIGIFNPIFLDAEQIVAGMAAIRINNTAGAGLDGSDVQIIE